MLRKHRLKEAVEWMQVHNAFVPLDKIFTTTHNSTSTSALRRAQSPAPLPSAAMGAPVAARPGSAML